MKMPRLLRKALPVSAAALAVAAASVAAPASASTNYFRAGLQEYATGSLTLNGDGNYAVMPSIYDMYVPTSGPGPSVTIASGDTVQGFSARFLQIGDPNSGAFMAVGYMAGATDFSDTGLNASRGVRKKFYSDGSTCPSSPTACSYSIQLYDEIQGGENHTYQIQRNALPEGYRYRMFIDGNLKRTVDNSMIEGYLTQASERGNKGSNTQTVRMAQEWTNLYYHRRGTASTNPPGLTAYTKTPNVRLDANDGRGCDIGKRFSGSTFTGMGVTGRC